MGCFFARVAGSGRAFLSLVRGSWFDGGGGFAWDIEQETGRMSRDARGNLKPLSASERFSEGSRRKRNGVHYTPGELAAFLAEMALAEMTLMEMTREPSHVMRVLDPACGAGALLEAIGQRRPGATLAGFELDETAAAEARKRLAGRGAAEIEIRVGDFLEACIGSRRGTAGGSAEAFDLVISNPPYVRTQTLGAERSRRLAEQFGLTGRVDLYQAFAYAAERVLRPGGVFALLTSNRFLTVQAGASLRRLFRERFEIRRVIDLGDTRFFQAAVLPVIVVAVKRGEQPVANGGARFVRVYSVPEKGESEGERPAGRRELSREGLLKLVGGSPRDRPVRVEGSAYFVESGELAAERCATAVWRLSNPRNDAWLAQVERRAVATFGDVGEIRVGIKTTADAVFVRGDWDALHEEERPEEELLRPLITHREAARWQIAWNSESRRVLYPYRMREGRRDPIRLRDFPRAAAYLQRYEELLRRREYLLESKRKWYEIWVPQQPMLWARRKIVFPDISDRPRFAIDGSGAIVQGDCYWIVSREGVDPDWLWLMLAVANSELAGRFYDLKFHNKLYAGRRRFMTQYVRQFPLPAISGRYGRALVEWGRGMELGAEEDEEELERLVRGAFGLRK